MDALKILEGKKPLSWEYDEEADVLYVSVGDPKRAVNTDIGDGVIVRYDEKKREVVGITLLGFRKRTMESLQRKAA